jgi:hypothetical protein
LPICTSAGDYRYPTPYPSENQLVAAYICGARSAAGRAPASRFKSRFHSSRLFRTETQAEATRAVEAIGRNGCATAQLSRCGRWRVSSSRRRGTPRGRVVACGLIVRGLLPGVQREPNCDQERLVLRAPRRNALELAPAPVGEWNTTRLDFAAADAVLQIQW